MAVPFARVTTGERFRPDARTWNAMVAAGEALARPTAFGSVRPQNEPLPPGVILVRNDTGSTIPRYGAVGFDGPILAADAPGFPEKVAMIAKEPDAETVLHFAVTLEPIGDGRTGWARLRGLMIATVNVRTEGDLTCGPIPSSHVLQSGEPGCEIVWLDSGSTPPEERMAVISVGMDTPTLIGKPATAFSNGALTSPNNVFNLWRGPWVSGDAATGKTIEAAYSAGANGTSDYGVATLVNGVWVVSCYPSA